MLKVFGSLLCPDCVACKAAFEKNGMEFEYHDFGEELAALKEFLKLRDSHPMFDEVRKGGYIGIPCIVDGIDVKLDWSCYVSQDNA